MSGCPIGSLRRRASNAVAAAVLVEGEDKLWQFVWGIGGVAVARL